MHLKLEYTAIQEGYGVFSLAGTGSSIWYLNSYGTDDSNSIAITKGSDRYLNITSSGNVGIGSDNPQNKLTVRDGDISLVDGANVPSAGRSIRFLVQDYKLPLAAVCSN